LPEGKARLPNSKPIRAKLIDRHLIFIILSPVFAKLREFKEKARLCQVERKNKGTELTIGSHTIGRQKQAL